MEKSLSDRWLLEQNPTWRVPSDDCYEIIKHYEGLKLEAYLCPAGIPTIGYGSTFYTDGKPVKPGDTITQQQAEDLLPAIVTKYAIEVNQQVKRKLYQHEFDALVSFVYNTGVGAFGNSTLLRYVNRNKPILDIMCEFYKWNKSKGRVLGGLVRRRATEAQLYQTGELKFRF